MSTPERTSWPDDRLNELSGRVRDAASKAEMENLRREMRERIDGVNSNVNNLRSEVRTIAGDPVAEGRQKRTAIVVGCAAALSGVGATSLLYILTEAAPH